MAEELTEKYLKQYLRTNKELNSPGYYFSDHLVTELRAVSKVSTAGRLDHGQISHFDNEIGFFEDFCGKTISFVDTSYLGLAE